MINLVHFNGTARASNHSIGEALASMTTQKRKELRTSVRITVALTRLTSKENK